MGCLGVDKRNDFPPYIQYGTLYRTNELKLKHAKFIIQQISRERGRIIVQTIGHVLMEIQMYGIAARSMARERKMNCAPYIKYGTLHRINELTLKHEFIIQQISRERGRIIVQSIGTC